MTGKEERPGPGVPPTDDEAFKGSAVYTPWTLAFYDLVVLGISNSVVWKCPSRSILNLYNEHVSDRHLDVGVGTGYFLDRCRFPSSSPTIALFDLNRNSLATTARRLRRYAPICHRGNVLQPIDVGKSAFGSIGLNYLLHCLPGTLQTKSVVFAHLKPLMQDHGVLFGSTILGKDVPRSALARRLMNAYNAKGIFSNLADCPGELEAGLKEHFDDYKIRMIGCVALFSARKRGSV